MKLIRSVTTSTFSLFLLFALVFTMVLTPGPVFGKPVSNTVTYDTHKVFSSIAEQGGREVNDARLDREDGEFGTLIAATLIAAYETIEVVSGAIEGGVAYEVENAVDPDTRSTNAGRAAAVVGGAVSGPIPGPFSSGVIGAVAGESVENTIQHADRIRSSFHRTVRKVGSFTRRAVDRITFWDN